MKVYVTARFKGKINRDEIEALCGAVRAAHMQDFCFVRDVENYKHTFDNPKDLWARTYDELAACDALLIDVSNHPTGGRVVEAGMAFAMRKPIYVIVKKGEPYKQVFDGIGSTVIEYTDYKEVTAQLKTYEKERNFNIKDQSMMFGLLVLFGMGGAWGMWQYSPFLGGIVAVAYWVIIRQIFASMRAFDRIIIYIPLAAVWLTGIILLAPLYQPLAWGWAIMFWFVTLLVLNKMKLSL